MTEIDVMSVTETARAPERSRFTDRRTEWLETDGLGGFAMGTVSGIRTRRYHALLTAAITPPTARFVLVNGVEAWIETPQGRLALTSHRYAPDATYPDGAGRIVAFEDEPWPRWTYRLEGGAEISHELFVRRDAPIVALSWRFEGDGPAALIVRPLLSGRDPHALHHENAAFRFAAERRGSACVWQPYDGVPGVIALANGAYAHDPEWYRNFLYDQERERGLDCTEDLASPGSFRFDLSRGEAVCVFAADLEPLELLGSESASDVLRRLRTAEKRRRSRANPRLERAADAYIVRRGEGLSVIAGYPWFADWGRDTFIAVRGLCLATGRLREAGEILLAWAGTVSQGMLPNRFLDRGDEPEFNSVDASLWFVIAANDWLAAMDEIGRRVPARTRTTLVGAILAIVKGYAGGTRYRIRMDLDGLLACGEPGVQLTWMDAKVDGVVVTPRIGKPVEVEALWLNALHIAAGLAAEWTEPFERGFRSFRERFWNPERVCLYDVVDVEHRRGEVDAALRPNQIFAVGGLPLPLFEGEHAAAIVEIVERELWTPLGLRSLAPGEPGYCGGYRGNPRERDAAYHQGTVWPWLAGAFIEAWVRTHGGTTRAKREARTRFFEPMIARLDESGLGHLPEIADGDPPHTPRGCPFQAWSVGEALRVEKVVLG